MIAILADKYKAMKLKLKKNSYIQITNKSEILIYNAEKILSADENFMSFRLPQSNVNIVGIGLKMKAIDSDCLMINGGINSVEFE